MPNKGKNMSTILLLLIGSIPSETIEPVAVHLGQVFNSTIKIKQVDIDLHSAYNSYRQQYNSSLILSIMRKYIFKDYDKVLGIVDEDLYSGNSNFVFGEAEVDGKYSLISITRLRQEFYNLLPDEGLFITRIRKEAVHELGHTYGLLHCSDRKCVMTFSNSLSDTDYKNDDFCPKCRELLNANPDLSAILAHISSR